jgi:hypothetical protein
VQKLLSALPNSWSGMKAHDVTVLNDQLREAKLPAINLPAAVEPPSEPSDQDEP